MEDIRKYCLQIDVSPGFHNVKQVPAKCRRVGYMFERIERNSHRKSISEVFDLIVDGEIHRITLIGVEFFLIVTAIKILNAGEEVR